MINMFDPPKVKASKNIRILKALLLFSLFVCALGLIFWDTIIIAVGIACLFYFLGSFITLKNVMDDLRE